MRSRIGCTLETWSWNSRLGQGRRDQSGNNCRGACPLERAGAGFALHSDFNLVVTPLSPLLVAEIATTRTGADGTVLAPGERISVDRALRAITIDAAHVLRRDHEVGSIEAGKLADFTVLADDPYAVDPSQIGSIEVIGTVLGGEPT